MVNHNKSPVILSSEDLIPIAQSVSDDIGTREYIYIVAPESHFYCEELKEFILF